MEPTWQDPPAKALSPRVPKRKTTYEDRYVALFEALREHPGRWALFAQGRGANLANNIRRGLYRGCEVGEFEAVYDYHGPGKYDTYVRYPATGENLS